MLKYHNIQYMAIASTKLVCIKQNPPLCLQSTPRGTQGFDKAGDFFVSLMVRTVSKWAGDGSAPIWQPLFSFPDKARGWLANIRPLVLLREAGRIC